MTVREYIDQLSNDTLYKCMKLIMLFEKCGSFPVEWQTNTIRQNIINLSQLHPIEADKIFINEIQRKCARRFIKIYNFINYNQ